MRQGYVAFLLFASLGARSVGGEAAVREIPDVTTIEQLQKLEPIRLASGWEVRLGLGQEGAEAVPWKLLYCQAKYLGQTDKSRIRYEGGAPGELLGPVFWDLEPDVEIGRLAAKARLMGLIPSEGLFCAAVPTAWKGRFVLRVFSHEGKVIQERRFAVEKEPPCVWQPIATERRRREDGALPCVARRKTFAAIPQFAGLTSLWPLRGDRHVQWGSLAEGTPLPGRIPVEYPWSFVYGGELSVSSKASQQVQPLKLSMDRGAFVVRSEMMRMMVWPDFHLLARWWVNGKAVLAERSERMEFISIGRDVSYANEVRVAFGWPDCLGALKAGDQIGLQVLYTPAIYRQLPREWPGKLVNPASASFAPDVVVAPLLSNRIDFAVTPDLLAAREKGNVDP